MIQSRRCAFRSHEREYIQSCRNSRLVRGASTYRATYRQVLSAQNNACLPIHFVFCVNAKLNGEVFAPRQPQIRTTFQGLKFQRAEETDVSKRPLDGGDAGRLVAGTANAAVLRLTEGAQTRMGLCCCRYGTSAQRWWVTASKMVFCLYSAALTAYLGSSSNKQQFILRLL